MPRGIAAEMADLVTQQWLVTQTGGVLHHATPTHAQSVALSEHRLHGILLTCGRQAGFVIFPSSEEARTLPRCRRCCKTTEIPPGRGSPSLDPACGQILAQQTSWPR